VAQEQCQPAAASEEGWATPSTQPEDGNVLKRGLQLEWEGPAMFETQSMLDARDIAGVAPGPSTKRLHLKRQLGAKGGSELVWLCTTLDRHGQEVKVVLKIYSAQLWYNLKAPLDHYTSRGLGLEAVWHWAPSPEWVTQIYKSSAEGSRTDTHIRCSL